MLDKRNLEQILSDQQEELEIRRGETLCHRPEEAQIDLGSTQAQIIFLHHPRSFFPFFSQLSARRSSHLYLI